MVTLLSHVEAYPTGKVIATRWGSHLGVHISTRPGPNTDEMREYEIGVRLGRTFTCKKADYEECFAVGIKAMQRDLYDELREPLYALEQSVYEENSSACMQHIADIRNLTSGGV